MNICVGFQQIYALQFHHSRVNIRDVKRELHSKTSIKYSSTVARQLVFASKNFQLFTSLVFPSNYHTQV